MIPPFEPRDLDAIGAAAENGSCDVSQYALAELAALAPQLTVGDWLRLLFMARAQAVIGEWMPSANVPVVSE